jgi:hypothetical protein
MNEMIGFNGTPEQLRKKLESVAYSTSRPYLNQNSNGWPNIEQFVQDYLREFANALALEISKNVKCYTQEDLEKDLKLR